MGNIYRLTVFFLGVLMWKYCKHTDTGNIVLIYKILLGS